MMPPEETDTDTDTARDDVGAPPYPFLDGTAPTPEELGQIEADEAAQADADERRFIIDAHRIRVSSSKARSCRREANATLLACLQAMLRPSGGVESYSVGELAHRVQDQLERTTVAVLREIELMARSECEGDGEATPLERAI